MIQRGCYTCEFLEIIKNPPHTSTSPLLMNRVWVGSLRTGARVGLSLDPNRCQTNEAIRPEKLSKSQISRRQEGIFVLFCLNLIKEQLSIEQRVRVNGDYLGRVTKRGIIAFSLLLHSLAHEMPE